MSNFSTSGVSGDGLEKAQIRNWLGYGIHRMAVTGYEIKEAKTGSKQVVLKFEGPKEDDPDFTPHQDAVRNGKFCTASFGSYLATEAQVTEFLEKVALVARHLGVSKEVDAIQSTDINSYMEAVVKIIKFKDAYWKICGREYEKSNGEGTGMVNDVARYVFIKGLGTVKDIVEEDGQIVKITPTDPAKSTMTFDPNNKYDIQRLTVSEEESTDIEGGKVDESATPLWQTSTEAAIVDDVDQPDDLPF